MKKQAKSSIKAVEMVRKIRNQHYDLYRSDPNEYYRQVAQAGERIKKLLASRPEGEVVIGENPILHKT